MPIGAEATKPEADATWKSNRDGSCSVGSTAPRSGRPTPIPPCHKTSATAMRELVLPGAGEHPTDRPSTSLRDQTNNHTEEIPWRRRSDGHLFAVVTHITEG